MTSIGINIMDKRFGQAHREARWAFGLAVAYLIAWLLAAYLPDDKQGITGLPHWFEMACLWVPLLFLLLCCLMVRFIYRDIPLEDNDAN
ncbi:putative membrane protein YhdT [Sodalis ligni]|jgi:uncharacterized membrane protein YhdT|uniref:Putative membrane protein YhdT n=2 Tax=Bruguierivoracaceae TaxID=2812006 RepID=A0A4R1NGE6_9GAMM|nr:putative membrane protein YhdT [Sodalis ligni]